MNVVTIGIGGAAALFGIYMAWVRQARPSTSKKLLAMKERFGDRGGAIVHAIAYTVVPIVFGIVLIVMGMRGGSVF